MTDERQPTKTAVSRGTRPSRRFGRYRRRLRFTREGKYFVALALAIGFAAINTGNNLLYLVLGMMLTLIVGSGVLSEQTLRRLRLSRQLPRRVFAGQPVLIGAAVRNDKRHLSSFSVEVEDLLEGQLLDKKCYFLKVIPGRTQQTSYRHTFARRGPHRFDGYRLSTRFPFSLFRKSREIAGEDPVVVYPRLVAVIPPEQTSPTMQEERFSRTGRRGDFFSLREFREGEDPRDIYWRKSAGAGRLLVRESEQPTGRRVTILLDNGVELARPAGGDDAQGPSGPVERDAQELAVSRAASLAVHYIRHGYAVALRSRTAEVRAGTGEQHLDRVLGALALIDFVPAAEHPLPPTRPGERAVWCTAGGV